MSDVTHETDRNRYVLTVEGEQAGVVEYHMEGEHRVFDHTEVDARFKGQGLSKPLIKGALDATRAEGIPYKATCSAVVGFMEKNPEYT